jgi:hypothetical protein
MSIASGVGKMEIDRMGCVLTEATLENLEDIWAVKRGLLTAEQVRRVSIAVAELQVAAQS